MTLKGSGLKIKLANCYFQLPVTQEDVSFMNSPPSVSSVSSVVLKMM